MKITYPTDALIEYGKRVREWHHWFAWRPVKVGDRTYVWLEYVDRVFVSYGSQWREWQYRPLGKMTNQQETKS